MKYVIVSKNKIEEVDFTKVYETSKKTLRYKLDGSEFILKFEGDTPSFLEGKTEYTHSEILNILSGSEWTPEELEL